MSTTYSLARKLPSIATPPQEKEAANQKRKEDTKMKRINARVFAPAVTTLAATLVLTFGTAAASAQTTRGNIPFGFTVAHKNMAPGAYAIAPLSRFDTGEP